MNLPNQFGPYLLLERISVGGMAEVYKAKEYGVEGFERTVAVKRILPHVAEDEEFIAMFKDEAKIAVQLNHGNIAQIYNLGNEQDSFYIALEYVNGRDLRAIFQKCQQQGKPMPPAQACYVIMKICEGLDYAHNKKDKYQRELNIVHRDVSPPNILVSFEGEVKLIDFGVAKAAGRASRTQAGILKGKFGYMSPEQVRGMPLDRRSDVFSVGVVLFEMLTGQRLFQADTDFATLEKVRAVDVPRPSSLNPEIPTPLENIIYKALAREPEQRYQSAIELHDELQAFMFAQGLFYSRKDLAAWMRHQYAREIELEKEKDKVRAAADEAPPSRPPRKTMMMAPGGRPPPPPPPRRTPPPTPHPTQAHAARGPATPSNGVSTGDVPTEAHMPVREEPAAGPPPPRPKPKRKTMVMTTARPNLPPAGHDGPTLPIADALPPPSKPTALPKPKSNKAKTISYVERPGAASPSAQDFDWDDEELETRLFEGEDGEKRPDAEQVEQVGGAIAATAEAPTEAAAPAMRPAVIAANVQPPPPPVVAAAPAHVPMPVASPPPPAIVPPVASPPAAATRPAPTAGYTQPHPALYGGGNPFPPSPVNHPQAAPAHPMAPPPAASHAPAPVAPLRPEYAAATQPRSNTGAIVAIVAAGAVLLVAGFATVLLLRDKMGDQNQPVVEATPAAAARGALTLQITPSSAKVVVDGQAVGGESPFVVSNLAPGKHQVTVTADGYMPIERQIDLGEVGLNLQFALQRRDLTLALESEPAGADMTLLVDGKPVPMGKGGAQYSLSRQPGAKYEVEASLKGYVTQRVPLEFSGEATQKVRVTLPKGDTQVAVADPATPTPAEQPSVRDDDPSPKRGGKKTPKKSTPSPRTEEDPPEPPKPPAASGAKTATLRIGTNSGVPPAEVYVDGKLVGKTPLPSVKVAPGSHQIRYKWPDGKEVKKTVTVGDGASEVVKAG